MSSSEKFHPGGWKSETSAICMYVCMYIYIYIYIYRYIVLKMLS